MKIKLFIGFLAKDEDLIKELVLTNRNKKKYYGFFLEPSIGITELYQAKKKLLELVGCKVQEKELVLFPQFFIA